MAVKVAPIPLNRLQANRFQTHMPQSNKPTVTFRIPDTLIKGSFKAQNFALTPFQIVKIRPWVQAAAMQITHPSTYDSKTMHSLATHVAFHVVGLKHFRVEETQHRVRTALRTIVRKQQAEPILNKVLWLLQQCRPYCKLPNLIPLKSRQTAIR